MANKKIVVLGGGFSSERYVSLASAANIAIHLRALNYDISTVDLCTGVISAEQEAEYYEGSIQNEPTLEEMAALKRNTRVLALLQSEPFASADIVFPVIHGEFGEDGRLQAILETANLPYVGSDYVGQALAMNKHLTKQLFVQNRIPTAPWVCLKPGEARAEQTGFPLVVKPAAGGSTVGISICHNGDELRDAATRAFKYDSQVIIEQFVKGREFTVGVMDGEVLAIGEIRSAATIFDYQAKYQASQTKEIFPAQLSQAVVGEVIGISKAVFEALHIRHYCRIDFILDAENRVFILEANAIPGMTRKSLFPQSAQAASLPFGVVCERLCAMALRDHRPLL